MACVWGGIVLSSQKGAAYHVLGQVELMREIEWYNEVDCRVMAEVIGYLRGHH